MIVDSDHYHSYYCIIFIDGREQKRQRNQNVSQTKEGHAVTDRMPISYLEAQKLSKKQVCTLGKKQQQQHTFTVSEKGKMFRVCIVQHKESPKALETCPFNEKQ